MKVLNLSLFIFLLFRIGLGLYDHESFLSLHGYSSKIEDALLLAVDNDWLNAAKSFEDASRILLTPLSLYHIYRCYKKINDTKLSDEWYSKFVNNINNHDYNEIYFQELDDLMKVGVDLYYRNEYEASIEMYNKVLEVHKFHVDAMFHIALSLQNLGRIDDASNIFMKCLKVDPFYIRARINLATLHHQYGKIEKAIELYNMIIHSFIRTEDINGKLTIPNNFPLLPSKQWIMVMLNLAIAYMQNGQQNDAKTIILTIIPPLEASYGHLNCSPWSDFKNFFLTNCDKDNESYNQYASMCEACSESRYYLIAALSNLLNIQRSVVYWMNSETITNVLLQETLDQIQLRSGLSQGPLLPFDTMLLSITSEDRKKIAMASSLLLLSTKTANSSPPSFNNTSTTNKLKIGFLSYDMNDHPTAHLVEAIFSIVQKQRKSGNCDTSINMYCNCELIIFNYGVHDNSSYRLKLEELSDKFLDIGLLSHKDASLVIESEAINILLDMQVHTLGNRMMILAHQPAYLQVNYLVYPGTSGAPFLDHIVVDHIVAPPEHAQYYSESYLLLPPTYQISYYDRHISLNDNARSIKQLENQKLLLRKKFCCPYEAIIACNFNKIDKIDQISFNTWMRILHRVSNSYLWILEPSSKRGDRDTYNVTQHNDIVKVNLINSAVAMGISPNRILFASRVSKRDHILRHRACDLFLDTFIYGAHSTATDALRGSLPVLTLKGPDFVSRVASSLYESFNKQNQQNMILSDILVQSNIKDFENSAVEILHNKEYINIMKMKLNSLILNNIGLFNTKYDVENFLHGMQALQEMKYDKTKNIIIL